MLLFSGSVFESVSHAAICADFMAPEINLTASFWTLSKFSCTDLMQIFFRARLCSLTLGKFDEYCQRPILNLQDVQLCLVFFVALSFKVAIFLDRGSCLSSCTPRQDDLVSLATSLCHILTPAFLNPHLKV